MSDAHPLAILITAVLLLIYGYIAVRLMVWAGAKSWWDFWKKHKSKNSQK